MPYQARSLGGGVAEGDVTSSPGCSGISVSAGEPGPCMPGGVEEVFRDSVDEPFRETQVVSITLTPMLETNRNTVSHTPFKTLEQEEWGIKHKEKKRETIRHRTFVSS